MARTTRTRHRAAEAWDRMRKAANARLKEARLQLGAAVSDRQHEQDQMHRQQGLKQSILKRQ